LVNGARRELMAAHEYLNSEGSTIGSSGGEKQMVIF
jgi:hypothetical protein